MFLGCRLEFVRVIFENSLKTDFTIPYMLVQSEKLKNLGSHLCPGLNASVVLVHHIWQGYLTLISYYLTELCEL